MISIKDKENFSMCPIGRANLFTVKFGKKALVSY